MTKTKTNKTADEPKRCPACTEIKPGFTGEAGAGNSYSRYVDAYICSPCGEREAFQKFFWAGWCAPALLRKAAKRRNMSVADLISL